MVRTLAIQFAGFRGIWEQGTSGRDDKWPKPSVPGRNKRRSPDLREESGLRLFSIQEILPRPEGSRSSQQWRRPAYEAVGCRFDLCRDHVVPRAQGGKDVWANVVTACRACNQRKGVRRPEQTRNMQLLFVPYAPCLWEHFILSARGILADQMDFLAARLPRHSRILN